MSRDKSLVPDEHFLSASNPIANVDQRDLEALAMKVFEMPVVIQARQQAAMRWKTCLGAEVPVDDWPGFGRFIDECCFQYALKAANSDANYPKVLGHVAGPAHDWFGMKVPGSRGGGGDCPDNNYVIIPIDPYAHFELSGRSFDPELADCPFVVTGDATLASTLGVLDWQDVQINPDGTFVIHIGPEPAAGRANYIQTKLEARYLFIREVRSDWWQKTNAYRIRRLDSPTAPPITIDQVAGRAAQYMVFEVPALYFFNRVMDAVKVNTCTPLFNTGTVGGLVTQMQSLGRIKLDDDEAYVITIGHGGARYRSVVLIDYYWLHSLSSWDRTISMNIAQSVPNVDGSTTYVLSRRDPGVYNWLNTAGYSQVGLMCRWQGLPRATDVTEKPALRSALVKFDELDAAVPKEMKRVTAFQRQQQQAERKTTLALRYIDS